MPVRSRLATAVLWLGWAFGAGALPAQDPPLAPVLIPPAALDVPYLPQSVLLCGGAAIAMVERWWGRRGVYAEDFAHLVRPELGGIRTTDLEMATRGRGWDVRAVRGTAELVRPLLRDGIPVVALLEVSRNRYHFVVVIRWHDGQVTFHDPASAPHATLPEAEFLRRWTAADDWALVVTPPPAPALEPTPTPDSTTIAPPPALPCEPWLGRALDAAAAGDLDAAERLLAEARSACPGEPLLVRELAAVRFRQQRHAEAARVAAEYVRRAPHDSLGWHLLAATRYLSGDETGALLAWNRLGRPRVDIVGVEGLTGTRFRVVTDAISLPHGTLLAPDALALARRRLEEIPAIRLGAINYRPVDGGRAEVAIAVIEHPVTERAERLVVEGAARALGQDEARLIITSPLGAGEKWVLGWRWSHTRARIGARADFPLRTTVVGVETAWERFRIGMDSGGPQVLEDSRRSANLEVASWVTYNLRPSAAVRVDRWSGGREYLALAAGGEWLGADDRLTLRLQAEGGVPLSGQPSYMKGGVHGRWISSIDVRDPNWSARIGLDAVSARAPLGIWPVTGGNKGWAIPLRAQSVDINGRLPGRRIGRRVYHAGLSADQPIAPVGIFVLAAGLFLDGARVTHSLDPSVKSRTYLDAGFGLRVRSPTGRRAVFHVDLARGLLVERRWAVAVGIRTTR